MSSIIRVEKNKNYFAVSNVPFQDKNLSWEARGMMGYLLSKPDDWKIMFHDLVNQTDCGDYKIRRILKELKENKYLVRKRRKSADGKFFWDSIVYEDPTMYQLPTYGLPTRGVPTCGGSLDIPSTDLPSTDLPSTEGDNNNPAPINRSEQIRQIINHPWSNNNQIGDLDELISINGFEKVKEIAEWVAGKEPRTLSHAITSMFTAAKNWNSGGKFPQKESTMDMLNRQMKELEDG